MPTDRVRGPAQQNAIFRSSLGQPAAVARGPLALAVSASRSFSVAPDPTRFQDGSARSELARNEARNAELQ